MESASGTGSGPASGSTSGPRVDAAGAAERKRAKLRQKKKEYKERKRRRRGGESDEALLDEEDEQAVDGGDPLSPAEAVCLVQELPDQLVMDGAAKEEYARRLVAILDSGGYVSVGSYRKLERLIDADVDSAIRSGKNWAALSAEIREVTVRIVVSDAELPCTDSDHCSEDDGMLVE